MRSKNLVILAAVAVALYFIFFQKKTGSPMQPKPSVATVDWGAYGNPVDIGQA
jgi:hypothetical protein